MMTYVLRQCFGGVNWNTMDLLEVLDDVEFFDCMDTCPDMFSLLDESDFNISDYPNEDLFSELATAEEPVCCHRYCVHCHHTIVRYVCDAREHRA